jgi:hypothetical protein
MISGEAQAVVFTLRWDTANLPQRITGSRAYEHHHMYALLPCPSHLQRGMAKQKLLRLCMPKCYDGIILDLGNFRRDFGAVADRLHVPPTPNPRQLDSRQGARC